MGLGLPLSLAQSVCLTGVPMDLYCIQEGNMIDNGLPTLQLAHEHTIHCLVDVPFCRDSGFEILVSNAEGTYDRAVRLDDFGNQEVLRIAREIGSCTTCTGAGSQKKNFIVTVEGDLVDATAVGDSDAEPPLMQVSSMVAGGTCDTVGGTPAPITGTPTTAPVDTADPTAAPVDVASPTAAPVEAAAPTEGPGTQTESEPTPMMVDTSSASSLMMTSSILYTGLLLSLLIVNF